MSTIFMVQPLVVGKGPRLFEKVKPENRLQLEFDDSKTFQSGAVALHYRMSS